MVNNGPLPMRPSPWLLDNWQLTPGNCFSKNASAEDTTARASRPNLSLGRYAEVGQQNSALPTYESNLFFPNWNSGYCEHGSIEIRNAPTLCLRAGDAD